MKLIILIFAALTAFGSLPADAKQSGLVSQRMGGSYKFINPLLECESDETQWTLLKPFQHKLDKFAEERTRKKVSHIAIYYRDLNNGPWFGVNFMENFTPASLLKVPVMMAYYFQAEQDPSILTKTLRVDALNGLNSQVWIKPSQQLKAGENYTVDELIRRMLVYSDNEATNLLCLNAGEEVLMQTYGDLGLNIPEVRNPKDFMSVRQYAAFFRILYNASYLNKKMSEKALETLSQSEFKDGIVAGVPANIRVSHKFGERVFVESDSKGPEITQLHDCGIVYYPGKPYLLCIMTRGPNVPELINVLQDVSKLVYREVDDQVSKNQK